MKEKKKKIKSPGKKKTASIRRRAKPDKKIMPQADKEVVLKAAKMFVHPSQSGGASQPSLQKIIEVLPPRQLKAAQNLTQRIIFHHLPPKTSLMAVTMVIFFGAAYMANGIFGQEILNSYQATGEIVGTKNNIVAVSSVSSVPSPLFPTSAPSTNSKIISKAKKPVGQVLGTFTSQPSASAIKNQTFTPSLSEQAYIENLIDNKIASLNLQAKQLQQTNPQISYLSVPSYQPNPSQNFTGGTVLGVSNFSSQNSSAYNSTVNNQTINNLTVSGNTNLATTTVTGAINANSYLINGQPFNGSGTTSGDSFWASSTQGNIFYNGGNVSIGTTTASGTLEVLDPNILINDAGKFEWSSTSTNLYTDYGLGIKNNDTTDGNYSSLWFESNDTNGNEMYPAAILGINVSHDASSTQGALALAVQNGNFMNEAMRILPSGNVGIGTQEPGALLDVEGSGLKNGTGTIDDDGDGNITGSGTLFTKELSVGDTIIVGFPFGVDGLVISIADDEHMTIQQPSADFFTDSSFSYQHPLMNIGEQSGPGTIFTASGYTADLGLGYQNSLSGFFSEALGAGNTIVSENIPVGSFPVSSVAIGAANRLMGFGTMAFGNLLGANGQGAMTIGSGDFNHDEPLINDTDHSLMVGFNSDIPTLFVGPSNGEGTVGNVGIGTSRPEDALEVDSFDPTSGIIATLQNTDSTPGTTGAQLKFTQTGLADWVIGQPADQDAFAFWHGRYAGNDGTEVARIDPNGNLTGSSYLIQPSLISSVTAGFVADGGNRPTVNFGINFAQFGGRNTTTAGSVMRFDARAGHPLFSVIYDAPGHNGGGGDENFPMQMTTGGSLLVGNGWSGDNNTGTGNAEDLQVYGSSYLGGKVGIGISNPQKSLVLNQQSTTDGFQFTGTSISNVNNGSGFLMALGFNDSGNKQLWLGDTDYAGSSSGYFDRFGVVNGYAFQDVVRGDGTGYGVLNLGIDGGSKVAVDGPSGTSITSASNLWVNGSAAIGGSYENANTNNGLVVQGNVGIGTSTPGHLITLSGGAYSDGSSWSNASDFNLKENFASVTPTDILQKIVDLPISQWNYKSDPASTIHMGPTAQNFYSAFGLNGPNGQTSISTIDEPAVALLGIQALNQKIIALQGGITGNATSSNLAVYNPANFSGDSVGMGKILAGSKDVRISFSQAYQYQPIVTLTPVGIVKTYYAVDSINSTGFDIIIDQAQATNTIFNWHSFASPAAQLTVSDGTTSAITLVVPQPPTITVITDDSIDQTSSSSTTTIQSEVLGDSTTTTASDSATTDSDITNSQNPTSTPTQEPNTSSSTTTPGSANVNNSDISGNDQQSQSSDTSQTPPLLTTNNTITPTQ